MARARARGWWYPYIFVGGFAVVLGVNMILLYFATSTFNGLTTEHAFDEGVAYNDEIAAARAQAALDWTGSKRITLKPGGTEGAWPVEVVATFPKDDGSLRTDLDVTVELRRPVQAGFDQKLTLHPATDGSYRTTATLPFLGQWESVLIADAPNDERFRLRERFMVRP